MAGISAHRDVCLVQRAYLGSDSCLDHSLDDDVALSDIRFSGTSCSAAPHAYLKSLQEFYCARRAAAPGRIGEAAKRARLHLKIRDVIQNPRTRSWLTTILRQLLPTVEASLLLQRNTSTLGDVIY